MTYTIAIVDEIIGFNLFQSKCLGQFYVREAFG
jgi:hypothetical protein